MRTAPRCLLCKEKLSSGNLCLACAEKGTLKLQEKEGLSTSAALEALADTLGAKLDIEIPAGRSKTVWYCEDCGARCQAKPTYDGIVSLCPEHGTKGSREVVTTVGDWEISRTTRAALIKRKHAKRKGYRRPPDRPYLAKPRLE